MSLSPEAAEARAAAIASAGEVYGAILADPDRRAELLAARRRRAAEAALRTTTPSSDERTEAN